MTIEKCPICYCSQISDDYNCLRCQAKLRPLILINQQVHHWSTRVLELMEAEYYDEAKEAIQQIKVYKKSDFWVFLEKFIDWRMQRCRNELSYRM